MAEEIDHYAVLGIAPSATVEEVRKAYHAKAKTCHPDRGGTHRQMRVVNEAWEILGDAVLRQQYDATRVRPVTVTKIKHSAHAQKDEPTTIISTIGNIFIKIAYWIGRGIHWIFFRK